MPVDMKETIAEAARTLLMEKRKKKLTVKDIVDECSITRQAFYYHFEDIPELFRWIIERDTEKLLKSSQALEDPEQRLRYFSWKQSTRCPTSNGACRAATATSWGVC